MKSAALILNGLTIAHPIKGDKIICADGGYNLAMQYNITPDIVVGDLDSAKDIADSVEVVKFSMNKDQTDGELAVHYAASRGCRKLHVYGVDGGRLDHIICNINLLKIGADLGVRVTLHTDDCTVYLSNSTFDLDDVVIGDIISIVPFSDDLHIINTEGLKYPIKNSHISKGSTIGISNIVSSSPIRIEINEGDALIFKVR